MIRNVQWIGWRVFPRLISQIQGVSSSATSAAAPLVEVLDKIEDPQPAEVKIPVGQQTTEKQAVTDTSKKLSNYESKNRLVAAAFAALKSENLEDKSEKKLTYFEESIVNADSVETLLKLAELPYITRHHSLKIISVLADWTASGRIKLSEFESDVRFVKLCRNLGKGLLSSAAGHDQIGIGDLATVLNITGDDEAAKLVAGISLPQMVKVMSTLAQKGRRSMALLRSLAYNISQQSDHLNIKQAADVLFGMAMLNFPDEVLLEKVAGDICESSMNISKSSVIGSILTSIGVLRYKNLEVIDKLSEWVTANFMACRMQDIVSLLLTLAMVNHSPSNSEVLFGMTSKHLSPDTVSGPSAWLDVVWSLAVLNKATAAQLSSVLSPEFIVELSGLQEQTPDISVAAKLKLLNINAVAQFDTPEYKGPLLPSDSKLHVVPLERSKDKKLFVTSIFDTLANLLKTGPYIRTNINTGMGFLLDGECILDSKCNPLPLSLNPESMKIPKMNRTTKVTKIGIMALDYHDLCRGSHNEPNGVMALNIRLLERRDYKVFAIPHTEFNSRDKLVRRVQYLEQQLKTLAKSN